LLARPPSPRAWKKARRTKHGDDLDGTGPAPIDNPVRPDDHLTKLWITVFGNNPPGQGKRLQAVHRGYDATDDEAGIEG
jgi:hypothetical protein